MRPEKAPDGKQPHEPGAKLDDGKPLVVKGFIDYFPKGIVKVSACLGLYGHNKTSVVVSIFPEMGNVFEMWLESIEHVAKVSEIGAQKYCWKGWKQVVNALDRYSEAMGRHEIKRFHDPIDQDYNTLHAAHTAWNAWAILEILLDMDEESDEKTEVKTAVRVVIDAMNILEDEITRATCTDKR